MKYTSKLIFICAYAFLFFSCNNNSTEWEYRKLLPHSASQIKEFYWKDGFLPDYEYYLRAKIDQRDFNWYCDSLGLELHTDVSKYTDEIGNLNTIGGYAEELKEWWNIDGNNDSLFVWQNGHEWNIARYYNGYLYLYAHEH
ncbi:MAG TPA: hypothetical protein VE933_12845 [Chitinophagaceae bacterium]|nr:hypothetical protein [Chitinophagaceae bacterium]